MRHDRPRNSWRTTLQIVATALLLFAFADLSFPQICAEETGSLSATTEVMSIGGAVQSTDSGPERSRDDCFCCCSHIESEPFATPAGSADLLMTADNVSRLAVPPVPVRIPFHPPRLA